MRSAEWRQLLTFAGRVDGGNRHGQKLLAFLHQPNEDTTLIRVIDPRAPMTDGGQGRTIVTESGADFAWTPGSDGVLIITGGWSPGSPTKGTIVRFAGQRTNVAPSRMPDSPLSLKWVDKSIIYIRHARLWRARFDSTGIIGEAEPLSAAPAMYSSVSKDGAILYISDGGLRLRYRDGREQRLGWPVSYTPPVPTPLLIRNVRIIDGTGRPPTDPQDVLLAGGKISNIAPTGTLRPSVQATLVDAGGRFIIPGMMDLHAHEYRPSLLAGFAYFGVTTIRDQGSHIAPLIAYADAIAAGKLNGPRVAFGGFQFYTDWAYDAEDQQGVEPEADPNHAARAVEMARVFGSQHIKTRTFRRWDINARLIAEAHRRGMRATGHCAHLLPLAAAGMDAKEHAGFCERSDGVSKAAPRERKARIARDGLAEVGVFAGHVPAPELQVMPYRSDRLMLMTPPDHPLAGRDSLHFHEAVGYELAMLGAVAGLGSVILVMLLGQSRVFYSMSRDGLLGKWAGEVHPRFRTPYLSTIYTGVGVAVFTGLFPIRILGQLVNIGTLLAFALVCGGVWVPENVFSEEAWHFRSGRDGRRQDSQMKFPVKKFQCNKKEMLLTRKLILNESFFLLQG